MAWLHKFLSTCRSNRVFVWSCGLFLFAMLSTCDFGISALRMQLTPELAVYTMMLTRFFEQTSMAAKLPASNQRKKKHDVVRISAADKEYLEGKAKATGTDMAKCLRKLIADDRRKSWFAQAREAEQAIRADTKAWEQESQERKLWDSLLQDGANQA